MISYVSTVKESADDTLLFFISYYAKTLANETKFWKTNQWKMKFYPYLNKQAQKVRF